MSLLCHQHNRVGAWVMERTDSDWFAGRGTTLGLLDSKGNLAAGCVFENYNGSHMFIHAASRPGAVTKEFLHACFHFCFIENHCLRVSCVVDESNAVCQRFVLSVGWSEDVRLVSAGLHGRDLLVYKMIPSDCKWLTEDEKNGIV